MMLGGGGSFDGNELENLGLSSGLGDGLGEYVVLSLNDFPQRLWVSDSCYTYAACAAWQRLRVRTEHTERAQDTGYRAH